MMFRLSKARDPFFEAFANHAELSVQAAKLLRELFEQPERIEALRAQIFELEHRGDTITRATLKRLRQQWITPIDRSDIFTLVTRLDDVLDVIESIAERMALFEVRSCTSIAQDLARVVETCVEAMSRAVQLLANARANVTEITALCAEVNRLEEEGDARYRTAIAALFKSGWDPLLVMKWREIYEELENATDACEDVANAVEAVVLEYA